MGDGGVPIAPRGPVSQPRSFMPPMGSRPGIMPVRDRAAMAQQRRNRAFSRAQAPRFDQFTGGGAEYIGARDGQVLYDYGNGSYKQGTRPDNLRDVQGNWTFLRS